MLHSKATAVSATANGNRLPTLPGLIDLSSYMSNQKSLHKQTDVDGGRMLHTSGPVGFLFLRLRLQSKVLSATVRIPKYFWQCSSNEFQMCPHFRSAPLLCL